MAHELCEHFRAADLPLEPRLAEMLDEHFSHRTERRGCGFTQATRHLAEAINRPRRPDVPDDLALLEPVSLREAAMVATAALAAGWPQGWRCLHAAPEAVRAQVSGLRAAPRLLGLQDSLAAIATQLRCEESQLILGLIRDLLGCVADDDATPALPSMPEKPAIGSCSAAEEYFLEIAHGRVRRGGEANVFVDGAGRPVLVEKVGLGESHSALSVQALRMNGVRLPPGSLFALERADPADARRHPQGAVLPLGAVRRARFLRLTTLSVDPAHRARAFSCQLEAQLQAGMFSPLSTTLEQLRAFAAQCVAAA